MDQALCPRLYFYYHGSSSTITLKCSNVSLFTEEEMESEMLVICLKPWSLKTWELNLNSPTFLKLTHSTIFKSPTAVPQCHFYVLVNSLSRLMFSFNSLHFTFLLFHSFFNFYLSFPYLKQTKKKVSYLNFIFPVATSSPHFTTKLVSLQVSNCSPHLLFILQLRLPSFQTPVQMP